MSVLQYCDSAILVPFRFNFSNTSCVTEELASHQISTGCQTIHRFMPVKYLFLFLQLPCLKSLSGSIIKIILVHSSVFQQAGRFNGGPNFNITTQFNESQS